MYLGQLGRLVTTKNGIRDLVFLYCYFVNAMICKSNLIQVSALLPAFCFAVQHSPSIVLFLLFFVAIAIAVLDAAVDDDVLWIVAVAGRTAIRTSAVH